MKNKSKNNTNRRQKVLAFIALAGLFASGLMVGLAFTKTKYVEKDVAPVISVSQDETLPEKTCARIEEEMLIRIDDSWNTDSHLDNAKVYSILAERGCPENSQKYVDLAKQEIAIARALEDDKFSEGETLEVVETYKRINMQAAAEEVFEKAKQLTNPAIDFILQVEKIINE